MTDNPSSDKKQDPAAIIAQAILDSVDDELGVERGAEGESDWRRWLPESASAIKALRAAGYVIVFLGPEKGQ